MVWAAVASDVNKFHLVFIDEGSKFNIKAYLNIFQKKSSFLAHRNFREQKKVHTGRCLSLHSGP